MDDNQRLHKIIIQEARKLLEKRDKNLKSIAYDLAEEMGLRKAYYGAMKTFDGTVGDVEVSIEYHGSGDSLTVYGSPKSELPSDDNTVRLMFKSKGEYKANLKDGKDLGSFSYSSPSNLKNKLKDLVNQNTRILPE